MLKKHTLFVLLAVVMSLGMAATAKATGVMLTMIPESKGIWSISPPREELVISNAYTDKIYKSMGVPINLNNGDIYEFENTTGSDIITVIVKTGLIDGHKNGQTVEYGYEKNCEYVSLGAIKLKDNAEINICMPADAGNVFIRNASTDVLYLKTVTVIVNNI